DGPDARDIGLEMSVGRDTAARVERDADLFQAKTVRIRTPSDGDEHHVGLDGLAFAAGGRLDAYFQRVARFLHADDLGRELEFHALTREDALELFAHLAVEP